MSSRKGASRQRSTPRSSSAGARRRTRRRRVLPAALTRGQRPFVFAFLALLVALVTMAATPTQRYFAMEERVESLTQERDELAGDVDALEERKEQLHDPEHIELLARRELGLVRPGEISYVVVGSDGDQALSPSERQAVVDDEAPWWRRLGETLGLLGDAGS